MRQHYLPADWTLSTRLEGLQDAAPAVEVAAGSGSGQAPAPQLGQAQGAPLLGGHPASSLLSLPLAQLQEVLRATTTRNGLVKALHQTQGQV